MVSRTTPQGFGWANAHTVTAGHRLSGGAGADTYVVNNSGDVMLENADEGTNTVQPSVPIL